MRTVFTPALLATSLFLAPSILSGSPAMAATDICINTRDILSSDGQDGGRSILFRMRDGTQWRNTLQGRCPDLMFEGYVWTVRNPDNTVCEREQTLRVLRSGQVCMLGKFEKVTPVPPPSHG